MEAVVLRKDILNLVYLAEYFGPPEIANFWEEVVHINSWHQHRIAKLIVKKLLGTVSGKKICILGFAFKANTNDIRESASIRICKDLIEEGAILFINDPKVSHHQHLWLLKKMKIILKKIKQKTICINLKVNGASIENIYKCSEGADAIVVLTEWEKYSLIDWQEISKRMRNHLGYLILDQ